MESLNVALLCLYFFVTLPGRNIATPTQCIMKRLGVAHLDQNAGQGSIGKANYGTKHEVHDWYVV